MIDWMTLTVQLCHLSNDTVAALRGVGDRAMRITPTGESVYDVQCWDSLRSDMTGVAVRCMSGLTVAGSPARTYQSNNAFGDGCPIVCFHQMLDYVEHHLKISLPHDPALWSCSRIDYNKMYDLGGPIAVRQALHTLRHAETRGNNISLAGDTVYWDKNSSYLSMKSYNKHTHAVRANRKKEALYTDEQLNFLQNLLRFELKFARHYFHRLRDRQGRAWYELTELDLQKIFNERIEMIIGAEMSVVSHDGLQEKFEKAAQELGYTPRMGVQAYKTYSLIKVDGYETVKRAARKSTFYRHQQIMKMVGLSKSDICSGRIHEFRRKHILIDQPVTGWNDIRLAG